MVWDRKFAVHAEEEKAIYNIVRDVKEFLFSPIADWLADNAVKPEHLSYLGLLMVAPFVFFFHFNPWISFFFLLIHVLLDGLDGSVARIQKQDGESGAFIDMVCDYSFFYISFVTFVYYGFVNGFYGLIFTIVYMALQGFVSLGIIKRIKLFYILRPKLLVYMFFLIYLITGLNYMNEFVVLMIIYLTISLFFIFNKIKCSLS